MPQPLRVCRAVGSLQGLGAGLEIRCYPVSINPGVFLPVPLSVLPVKVSRGRKPPLLRGSQTGQLETISASPDSIKWGFRKTKRASLFLTGPSGGVDTQARERGTDTYQPLKQWTGLCASERGLKGSRQGCTSALFIQ